MTIFASPISISCPLIGGNIIPHKLVLTICAVTILCMVQATVGSTASKGTVAQITTHRTQTQHLRSLMGLHSYATRYSERKTHSKKYHKWVLKLWKKRHEVTWKQYLNPPHKAAWECIHSYEGSWTDPNSPYWGGLQMDEGFQKAYGLELYRSKGTADHWTPLEQMWVAERAYKTRGFYPWPNTARFCHLI